MPPIGQPQAVPITVRPAAVFPLDVYFLMDFSESMNDDLATLQSIAENIGMYVGFEELHNSFNSLEGNINSVSLILIGLMTIFYRTLIRSLVQT